jgi:hypothetical protein
VAALQIVDTTFKTLKLIRTEEEFKSFYDRAVQLAEELGVEVKEPRQSKVSRRIDENFHNQHVVLSNEEKFRAELYYEVIDIMVLEFERRFNQESRQYLKLLSDILNRKMPDDAMFETIASHFTIEIHSLKAECALFINDDIIDTVKPYQILKQQKEKKRTTVYTELTLLLKKLCTIPFLVQAVNVHFPSSLWSSQSSAPQ